MSGIDWRKTLTLLSLFILILSASIWFFRPTDAELAARSEQSAAIAVLPQERIAPSFDDRSWQLSREVKQDNKYSADYLPQGDSLPSWKELITIQAFGGLQDKGSPEEFASAMEKRIREWGGEKVTWKVLSVTDTDLIYEWQVNGKENHTDQYEICRIIKGNDGLHLVHYAIRTPAIDAAQRAAWLKRLQAATVKELPKI